MNKIINIVLYFWSDYDSDYAFNKLIKFFEIKDYDFSYDLLSNQIFLRNNFEDDYRKEIKIDIRSGDACKLSGLRPDFYFADTKEARNFLRLGADKVGGISLQSWLDILKLIELFRR